MICKYVCLSLLRVITNVNILQSIPFLPEGNAKFFLKWDQWSTRPCIIYNFIGIFWGYAIKDLIGLEEVTEKTEKCPKWKIKNLEIVCLPRTYRVYHLTMV